MGLQTPHNPVQNDSESQKSREGLSQVDTQSDLHFKYIPLYKQLVKCSFAYECGNC